MKKRFTDEQVIAILREVEAGTASIKTMCKKLNNSEQTLSRSTHIGWSGRVPITFWNASSRSCRMSEAVIDI